MQYEDEKPIYTKPKSGYNSTCCGVAVIAEPIYISHDKKPYTQIAIASRCGKCAAVLQFKPLPALELSGLEEYRIIDLLNKSKLRVFRIEELKAGRMGAVPLPEGSALAPKPDISGGSNQPEDDIEELPF